MGYQHLTLRQRYIIQELHSRGAQGNRFARDST